MNEKQKYEEVRIDLIFMPKTDVITTSGGDGEGSYDKDGWA